MKGRPIVFRDFEVRAVREDKKTQARIPCTPPRMGPDPALGLAPGKSAWHLGGPHWVVSGTAVPPEFIARGPYGRPGDRLWVRETWFCDDSTAGDLVAARSGYVGTPPSDKSLVAGWREHLYYRADGECCDQIPECSCCVDGSPWLSSTQMPRWAARLVLEVLEIRVERLQDISESDLRAEINYEMRADADRATLKDTAYGRICGRREVYERFWDLKYGKRAPWSSNPWVWVVIFKRIELA